MKFLIILQIAPAPPEELPVSLTNPQSGIDLVIHIDVEDDTIIRRLILISIYKYKQEATHTFLNIFIFIFCRAVGRRLDPVTGITYHLEYTPPPEHKVTLFHILLPLLLFI
jgi:hypothetical protein